MGIKGLFKLLQEECPNSCTEITQKSLAGKTIAIDASIAIYQFMVQIRINGQYLTNEDGVITSHIQGFFNRTANLLSNNIKPIFVFDGVPPEHKINELNKRRLLKQKAEKEAKDADNRAKNAEDDEERQQALDDKIKADKKNIRITRVQIEEIKTLLRLMGVSVVEAECEAEAQCAQLVKEGIAYAVGTEDMDALTHGSHIVLRNLTDSKKKIIKIDHKKILEDLKINHDEFIDLCILCGCDYSISIKGIASKTALKLIREYRSIENIINKFPNKFPDEFKDKLETTRNLFKYPSVKINTIINCSEINKEKLINFLVNDRGFDITRVNNILKKINNQKSIESFFKTKTN